MERAGAAGTLIRVPVLFFVAGSVLVLGAICDAVNTLVVTRLQVGRWWPTEVFYRALWPLWRRLGRVRDDRRREIVLSMAAPTSILGLLVAWGTSEILGWGLIWWALRESFAVPLSGPGDALYFSGVAFFSIGFGDILPAQSVARVLTLVEAASGLSTLALVIGYLPALYGAYSSREAQLLMLDDLTGERIMPTSLIEAHCPDGQLDRLYDFFHEWERWCAQTLETHTSYPMLALFRSQHLGQSWVTALGVVLDAATLAVACIPGADQREPMFLYRRGNRLLHHFIARLDVRHIEATVVDRSLFRIAYGRLAARGIVLRDFEDAFARLESLRATYAAELESLIEELLAPHGFWSHTITGRARGDGQHRPDPDAGEPEAVLGQWDPHAEARHRVQAEGVGGEDELR